LLYYDEIHSLKENLNRKVLKDLTVPAKKLQGLENMVKKEMHFLKMRE
jgi:hypothetical protein